VMVLSSQCWQWREVTIESCQCGTVDATWPWRDVATKSCRQWWYRGNICCRAMSLLSHAGDDTAEATWSWREVDTDS
jgi:hypothetical protein